MGHHIQERDTDVVANTLVSALVLVHVAQRCPFGCHWLWPGADKADTGSNARWTKQMGQDQGGCGAVMRYQDRDGVDGVYCMLYVVCFILYVVCCMMYDICCMLYVVCWMVYVVYYMVYVICCVMTKPGTP